MAMLPLTQKQIDAINAILPKDRQMSEKVQGDFDLLQQIAPYIQARLADGVAPEKLAEYMQQVGVSSEKKVMVYDILLKHSEPKEITAPVAEPVAEIKAEAPKAPEAPKVEAAPVAEDKSIEDELRVALAKSGVRLETEETETPTQTEKAVEPKAAKTPEIITPTMRPEEVKADNETIRLSIGEVKALDKVLPKGRTMDYRRPDAPEGVQMKIYAAQIEKQLEKNSPAEVIEMMKVTNISTDSKENLYSWMVDQSMQSDIDQKPESLASKGLRKAEAVIEAAATGTNKVLKGIPPVIKQVRSAITPSKAKEVNKPSRISAAFGAIKKGAVNFATGGWNVITSPIAGWKAASDFRKGLALAAIAAGLLYISPNTREEVSNTLNKAGQTTMTAAKDAKTAVVNFSNKLDEKASNAAEKLTSKTEQKPEVSQTEVKTAQATPVANVETPKVEATPVAEVKPVEAPKVAEEVKPAAAAPQTIDTAKYGTIGGKALSLKEYATVEAYKDDTTKRELVAFANAINEGKIAGIKPVKAQEDVNRVEAGLAVAQKRAWRVMQNAKQVGDYEGFFKALNGPKTNAVGLATFMSIAATADTKEETANNDKVIKNIIGNAGLNVSTYEEVGKEMAKAGAVAAINHNIHKGNIIQNARTKVVNMTKDTAGMVEEGMAKKSKAPEATSSKEAFGTQKTATPATVEAKQKATPTNEDPLGLGNVQQGDADHGVSI